jgi:hypothetical protein
VEETALHFCGRAGDARLVKHLLSCGADGNVEDGVDNGGRDETVRTVPILHLACCSGRWEDVHKQDRWFTFSGYWTPKWCQRKRQNGEGGEDISYIGINPWYLKDDLSIVEALIKYADVNNQAYLWYNYCDEVNPTDPLYFAIAGVADDDEDLLHHKKIVQLLVEKGADTYDIDPDDMRQTVFKEVLHGKHSLLAAAALSNVQAVSEHIAKGADLGARNLRGRTALLLACLSAKKRPRHPWTSEKEHQEEEHQAQEVAALLIEPTRAAGALDAVDNDGMSSLIVARKNGLHDIVKMLLKAGAK